MVNCAGIALRSEFMQRGKGLLEFQAIGKERHWWFERGRHDSGAGSKKEKNNGGDPLLEQEGWPRRQVVRTSADGVVILDHPASQTLRARHPSCTRRGTPPFIYTSVLVCSRITISVNVTRIEYNVSP